jgi:hypothetical protein
MFPNCRFLALPRLFVLRIVQQQHMPQRPRGRLRLPRHRKVYGGVSVMIRDAMGVMTTRYCLLRHTVNRYEQSQGAVAL